MNSLTSNVSQPSEQISPSDQSELERINKQYKDMGLGEPIHVEETNELLTEDMLTAAANEMTGVRE